MDEYSFKANLRKASDSELDEIYQNLDREKYPSNFIFLEEEIKNRELGISSQQISERIQVEASKEKVNSFSQYHKSIIIAICTYLFFNVLILLKNQGMGAAKFESISESSFYDIQAKCILMSFGSAIAVYIYDRAKNK